jgi:hypothetical protein
MVSESKTFGSISTFLFIGRDSHLRFSFPGLPHCRSRLSLAPGRNTSFNRCRTVAHVREAICEGLGRRARHVIGTLLGVQRQPLTSWPNFTLCRSNLTQCSHSSVQESQSPPSTDDNSGCVGKALQHVLSIFTIDPEYVNLFVPLKELFRL